MRNSYVLYAQVLILALVLGACGKKSTTTSTANNSTNSDGRGSGSGSTPRGNGSGTDTIDDDDDAGSSTTDLTCTTPIVIDNPGQRLAAFFGKVYVPTSGTGSPQSLEEERAVIASGWDSSRNIATKVYDVEAVAYCLTISGSGASTTASLRIEYEDAIALSWYNAPSTNFLAAKESGNTLSLYWFDPAGFVRLSGTLQSDGLYHADIRYVNFPTTAQVNNTALFPQSSRATTLHDSSCLSKDSSGAWTKLLSDCVTQRLLSFKFFGLDLSTTYQFTKRNDYPNYSITFDNDHKIRWTDAIDLYVTDAYASDFDRMLIEPGYLGSLKLNRSSVTK